MRFDVASFALALPLVAAAVLAGPVASQAPTATSFVGTYAFAGGQRDRNALSEEIDRVVDQMNVFMRTFARSSIHAEVFEERRIVIAADERSVTLTFDGWGPQRIPLGGRVAEGAGPDGSHTRFTARLQNDRLTTRFRTDRGYRDSWFSLAADGRHMYLQVRIVAPQLPDSIRYSLTYRRR